MLSMKFNEMHIVGHVGFSKFLEILVFLVSLHCVSEHVYKISMRILYAHYDHNLLKFA